MGGNERREARESEVLRAALRAAGWSPSSAGFEGREGCPDAEDLAARHEDRLGAAEALRVDEHAAGCASCRALLDHLAAGPPGAEAEPGVERRRNRVALAVAVAAVATLILGARLLLVGSGAFDSARRIPASGGLVVAARGGAAAAGRSEAIEPGEFLPGGMTLDLKEGGEVVIATPDGFLSLSGSGTGLAHGDGDDARNAARAIHGLGATREARVFEAKAGARRGVFDALELVYPRGTVLDPRPGAVLALPSAAKLSVRVERVDGDRAAVFEDGPAELPRPFPAGQENLESGVEYRLRLLASNRTSVASARFRVASPEDRSRADAGVALAMEAAGADPAERGFARALALFALGYPADGLREGLDLVRSSPASAGFRLEMGIAAQNLGIDSLVAKFFYE